MTLIIPKKSSETLGEIRERLSRLTKRVSPNWWQQLMPDVAATNPATPLSKKPDTGEEDGKA